MNRRNFISNLSVIPLLPYLTCQGNISEKPYSLDIQSDRAIGHLLLNPSKLKKGNIFSTDYLIVGGGVAGIASAYLLRNQNFLLFELSENIGGTSSATLYKDTWLCQGAHYDLHYPQYFGQEILDILSEINLIQFNPQTRYWEFQEKQYLISDIVEGQTFWESKYQEDVLPDTTESSQFLKIMEQFQSKIKAPTRLIAPELYGLNKITFFDYLHQKFQPSDSLLRSIDYQLLDDFGGNSHEVSALAGTYYYTARPYLDMENVVFSPPEGNFYFIRKFLKHIPSKSIKKNHLVNKITPQHKGFEVEVLDVKSQSIHLIHCQNIIYAAPKHTLPYTFPQDAPLFEHIDYAPWLVLNLILQNEGLPKGFWQNEILTKDKTFLGFVDSDAQFTEKKNLRVLTVYFCFPPTERKYLTKTKTISELAEYAIQLIAEYFQLPLTEFSKRILKIIAKPMGHAMPIPKPHYLFKDQNTSRSHPHLVFAGVDNGRLPLFFEALDSAMMAIENLKNVYDSPSI